MSTALERAPRGASDRAHRQLTSGLPAVVEARLQLRQARSASPATPACAAQWAQQKMRSSASTP